MIRILSTAAAIATVGLALAGAPAHAQAAQQSTAALSGVDTKDLSGGYRASKVIGSTVVNEQNETVGKIDDLIVSKAGAHEPVAVLSVGGFLGVGSKLVAIKYDQLKANPDKSEFVLAGATKDGLKALPDFEYPR